MFAPLPLCEPARILALYLLDVLDTESDPACDAIVALAARICAIPIALISLVDTNRQWFKARHGLDVSETPIELAFCAYAVLQSEIFIVSDTWEDARFARHPLVIGEPHIRFYAGVPLVTDEGLAIGTLCIIDQRPRSLASEQKQALQSLAKHTMHLLALNRYPAEVEGFAEQRRVAQAALQASRTEIEILERQWA